MHPSQQPKPIPPEIDFAREMVIVVALGQISTGGYGIGVQDIQEGNDSVEVTVAKLSPGPNCLVIQIETAPLDIVRLKKTTKPVVFKVDGSCINANEIRHRGIRLSISTLSPFENSQNIKMTRETYSGSLFSALLTFAPLRKSATIRRQHGFDLSRPSTPFIFPELR
jgi:hypothetical protein